VKRVGAAEIIRGREGRKYRVGQDGNDCLEQVDAAHLHLERQVRDDRADRSAGRPTSHQVTHQGGQDRADEPADPERDYRRRPALCADEPQPDACHQPDRDGDHDKAPVGRGEALLLVAQQAATQYLTGRDGRAPPGPEDPE
jgi:hypothetical protein